MSIVQSSKEIEITRASDFLVLRREEMENVVANLENLFEEYDSVRAKLQRVLQLKHDTIFFLNQKMVQKEVKSLEDISILEEPIKLGEFYKKDFAVSVVEQIQTRFQTRLSENNIGNVGDDNQNEANQYHSSRSNTLTELYKNINNHEWKDVLDLLTSMGTDEKTGVKILLDILKELSLEQPVWQKQEVLECALQTKEEECAALEATRKTQEREILSLKDWYDDMLQKYQAEVRRNDYIQEKAESAEWQIRNLRRRAQVDQEDKQLRRQIMEKDDEIRDLKDSNTRELQQKEEQLRVTTMHLREKENEIASLKAGINSVLSRQSKETGDKPSVNYPGLADLSDPNKSTKIAELYDRVYDNEWADALDRLTHQGTDEETGIRCLLDTMKHIYSFCTKAKEEMMQELRGRLANPMSGGTHIDRGTSSNQEDQQIRQMLGRCVKLFAKTAISNLHKVYSQMKLRNKPRYVFRLPEYVSKCIEICWLMNTQSPSMIFAEPLQSGENIDKDRYKEYTQQGDVVSFVVWLPLLLQQDGAVLSKGVVQPIPRPKSKSERRTTSSKSASVKSSSNRGTPAIRETRDRRYKEVVSEIARYQHDRRRYDSGDTGRKHTGSRLSSSASDLRLSVPDGIFQDSRHRTGLRNTNTSTPSLSRSKSSPDILSTVYPSECAPTVPSHKTSKKYYKAKPSSRLISERPTSYYSSHRKTAAYSNERARTIEISRPESDKASHINPSEFFTVGGHNYTLHKGRLYKQDPLGEWHFTRDIGDS